MHELDIDSFQQLRSFFGGGEIAKMGDEIGHVHMFRMLRTGWWSFSCSSCALVVGSRWSLFHVRLVMLI